eukprot:5700670-Pleurochrysis_carterae.AAC.1
MAASSLRSTSKLSFASFESAHRLLGWPWGGHYPVAPRESVQSVLTQAILPPARAAEKWLGCSLRRRRPFELSL